MNKKKPKTKKKPKIKRYEKEFTDAEIDSQVQEFRRGAKEDHPDENEELFPNNAEELKAYITSLEESYKNNPTEPLREEIRVYKAHQTGIYKGFCIAYEQTMSLADYIKQKHPAEEDDPTIEQILEDQENQTQDEDEVVNNLATKKVFDYLKKEKKVNPRRKISKKELLEKTRLTREELEEAGIQNMERYITTFEPTLLDGGPMFETEEDFQKMKKVLADDPNTPKGHWVEDGQVKQYIFDKPKKEKGGKDEE